VIERHSVSGFSTRSKERVCSIADEAIVPNISSCKHRGEGGDVVDNRFNWAFFRLLTQNIGVGIDGG